MTTELGKILDRITFAGPLDGQMELVHFPTDDPNPKLLDTPLGRASKLRDEHSFFWLWFYHSGLITSEVSDLYLSDWDISTFRHGDMAVLRLRSEKLRSLHSILFNPYYYHKDESLVEQVRGYYQYYSHLVRISPLASFNAPFYLVDSGEERTLLTRKLAVSNHTMLFWLTAVAELEQSTPVKIRQQALGYRLSISQDKACVYSHNVSLLSLVPEFLRTNKMEEE